MTSAEEELKDALECAKNVLRAYQLDGFRAQPDRRDVETVASALLSLQDQLTQVRAENEGLENETRALASAQENAYSMTSEYMARLEAAEKREKALREFVEQVAAQKNTYTMRSGSNPEQVVTTGEPTELAKQARRILERGEQ